jgi:hypothetical protein
MFSGPQEMVQQFGNDITRTDMVSATVISRGYLPHGELVSTMTLCREAANYTCIGYSNGLVEIRSTNNFRREPLYEVTLEQSKVINICFFKDEFGSLHVVHENGVIKSSILGENGDDSFYLIKDIETA